MKNSNKFLNFYLAKKTIFLGLLFLLTTHCGNNVEPLDSSFFNVEPNPDEVKITIDGLESINYTEVNAITIDSTVTISDNGIFKNPYTPNNVEDLPVLVVENDEILLGYFPHTLKSNKVDIDDILLFYFLTYPELAIQGLEYQSIMQKIKSSKDYMRIKEVVISNLDINNSPINDNEFNELIRKITSEIKTSIFGKIKSSKKLTETFKFTYDREGEISWGSRFPLYAAVGISIENTTTSEYLLQPKLLESESLVFSPTSIISWAFNELFTDNNEVKVESANFDKEGIYKVRISNGNKVGDPDSPLYDYTRARNILFVNSNLLGYIIPITTKTIKSEPKCLNSIIELQDHINIYVTKLIFERRVPNSGELIKDIIGLSGPIDEIFVKCLSGSSSRYIKLLKDTIVKRLSLAEDVATLLLLLRDFIGTDLYQEEFRTFSNQISFGKLQGKEESEIEFEGDTGNEYFYSKVYEELELKYSINRGVAGSEISKVDNWIKALDLPFLPEVISGDAEIQYNTFNAKNQIETDYEGKISVKMIMGEKPSEVRIKHDVGINKVEDVIVKLNPTKSISVLGPLDYGEVRINTEKTQTLIVENKSNEILNISSIDFPEGFSTSAVNVQIEPYKDVGIPVKFKPTEIKDYSGTITVNNNIDNENNAAEVIGFGTDDKITLQGDLNFGEVLINPENPPIRTLTISNLNPNTDINVNPIVLPNGYSATGWVDGGLLKSYQQQQINITFNPTVVGNYDNTLEIVNDIDQINNKIEIKGQGIEEQGFNMSGEWIPTWDVAQCDILGSYCCGCSFHENTRNFVFIESSAGCNSADICGILDWNTQRIGNSDTPTVNEWSLNGETLTIKIVSAQSSGWQFTYRDLNFTATYSAETDSFTGSYTADFTGGLIVSAKSHGTLTLTRVK